MSDFLVAKQREGAIKMARKTVISTAEAKQQISLVKANVVGTHNKKAGDHEADFFFRFLEWGETESAWNVGHYLAYCTSHG
jgi:hypothetical protein